MNIDTTTDLQADIERIVYEARAERAEVMRAAASELATTIKHFVAGFHRSAPHKSVTA